jgi:hypothetical protein
MVRLIAYYRPPASRVKAGGEAQRAVAKSHEMMNSWERRLWLWSNATCAMPLCEALSSRRGRRAHHAQMDCVGTWDIPRLAVG